MARIFISYSRKDKDFARKLADDLDRLGGEAWIDVDDIHPTEDRVDKIHAALKECQLMLAITLIGVAMLFLNGGSGGNYKKTATPIITPIPTLIPADSTNAQVWPKPIIQSLDNVEMVYVPTGCFMMGSTHGFNEEKPVHEVCLSAYWIDRTEVTNAQYKTCVDAGACTSPENRTYYDDSQYANHPVIYVDWNQASEYAAWKGGSLPTEAQWEYAARGPEGLIYPWGNERGACDLANTGDCVGDSSVAGNYPAGVSWVGALDMAGNVWEWTADWYGDYPSEHQQDPTGPVSSDWRVIRGGSWGGDQGFARCVYRLGGPPDHRYGRVGFRVVRVP